MQAIDGVFRLSEQLVDAVAALRPMQATAYGVPGYDHLWDDLSPAGAEHTRVQLRTWLARLDAVPVSSERWEKLASHVMRDWLDLEISGLEHGDYQSDLNSIASPFQNIRMTFDSMDLTCVAGFSNVASRLETVEAVLRGYQASLEAGLRAGRGAAPRQVLAAIEQGHVHAGPASYFRSLPGAFAAAGLGDSNLGVRIDEGVHLACKAYGDFSEWLAQTYLPCAKAPDGVGRDRYTREMRKWLGSTPDLEETYAWGWTEVRRLTAEMDRVGQLVMPGASRSEITQHLLHGAAQCAADPEAFLQLMRARQAQALHDLDGKHFDVPHVIRSLEVKLAPPGGPLGAYYMVPSEDFSRAGAVFYALEGEGPVPLFDQISTAYHEGFPGHHLQCGLQVSLTHVLCRLHRVAYGYSGYAEGWALYVERLMGELGYYERPEYEYGMLANQMLRACRVVFDIGAHVGFAIPADAPFHPGEAWSFELGVEMLSELGLMSPEHARSEITRYYGWPAQAISYKVGERAILKLRESFLEAGGDLKAFHTRVLACGNVSLDLLRDQVLGPRDSSP
jgi:uncharacterized protein (DUF885 family)